MNCSTSGISHEALRDLPAAFSAPPTAYCRSRLTPLEFGLSWGLYGVCLASLPPLPGRHPGDL